MDIIDTKIDFIVAREDTINNTLMTRMMSKQSIYGKVDTKLSIEITKLLFLLNSKGWYGDNLKLELYKKLLDMTRKAGLIFKIPEPVITAVATAYHGVYDKGLLADNVLNVLTFDAGIKEDKTYLYSTDGSQVYYFVYPKSWGILSRIYDTNGFNTLNGYTPTEIDIIVDGAYMTHYMYEFLEYSDHSALDITFKF